jgi:autotransporter-associated beta strand protein
MLANGWSNRIFITVNQLLPPMKNANLYAQSPLFVAAMKRFLHFPCLLILGLALAGITQSAQAATFTWGGGGADGNWNTAGNWINGSAPAATGAALVFAGSTNLSATNNIVTQLADASGTGAAAITFASGAGAFTLSGSAVTFSAAGELVYDQATNIETVGLNLTLPGSAASDNVDFGAAGTLVFNGNIIFGTNRLFNTSTTTAGTIVLNGSSTGAGVSTTVFSLPSLGYTLRNNVTNSVFVLGNSAALGTGAIQANATTYVESNTSLTGANAVANTFVLANKNLYIAGSNNLELSGTADLFTGGTAAGAIVNAGGNNTLYITNTGTTTISGNVSLSDTPATGRTLTVDVASAAGTTTISGTIVDCTVATGVAGGFTKADSGTLYLTGNNPYLSVTTITGGILSTPLLANGGSASGIGASSNAATNLILDGGTLQYTGAGASTDRLFSLQASSTIDASGAGAVNFTNTGAMGFTVAKTLTLTGTNTGANTLAAVIGDNTGATSIIKNGSGAWTLSGANTYSGGTTINAGTVNVGSNTAFGTGTVSITGATVNPPVVGNASGGLITLANSISLTGANSNVYLSPGTGGITFNGGLSLGSDSLFGVGTSGTLTFNAAGTGAGASGSIFSLTSGNNTQVTQAFRANVATTLVLGNNAALGTGAIYDNASITVGSNTSLTGANAVGNLLVLGAGNMTIGGSSPIQFSGTSTTVGTGGAGTAGAIINTGGSRTLYVTNTAATTISGIVSLSDAAATGRTLTVDVASTAGTTTISGVIQDYIGANGSGTGGVAGSLIKADSGALTLSGDDTYTGTTTVSGGTLIVSGSLSGAGAVTVNSGATLAGYGEIAGPVTVSKNGTLAPAATASTTGTDTFGGSLTLSGTSTVALNLNPGASTPIDFLNVSGALSIGSNDSLTVALLGTATAGTSFEFATAGSITGSSFANVTLTGYNASSLTASVVESGGDILTLDLVAIPEPRTWAMFLGGFISLVIYQRSRRRRGQNHSIP